MKVQSAASSPKALNNSMMEFMELRDHVHQKCFNLRKALAELEWNKRNDENLQSLQLKEKVEEWLQQIDNNINEMNQKTAYKEISLLDKQVALAEFEKDLSQMQLEMETFTKRQHLSVIKELLNGLKAVIKIQKENEEKQIINQLERKKELQLKIQQIHAEHRLKAENVLKEIRKRDDDLKLAQEFEELQKENNLLEAHSIRLRQKSILLQFSKGLTTAPTDEWPRNYWVSLDVDSFLGEWRIVSSYSNDGDYVMSEELKQIRLTIERWQDGMSWRFDDPVMETSFLAYISATVIQLVCSRTFIPGLEDTVIGVRDNGDNDKPKIVSTGTKGTLYFEKVENGH